MNQELRQVDGPGKTKLAVDVKMIFKDTGTSW